MKYISQTFLESRIKSPKSTLVRYSKYGDDVAIASRRAYKLKKKEDEEREKMEQELRMQQALKVRGE